MFYVMLPQPSSLTWGKAESYLLCFGMVKQLQRKLGVREICPSWLMAHTMPVGVTSPTTHPTSTLRFSIDRNQPCLRAAVGKSCPLSPSTVWTCSSWDYSPLQYVCCICCLQRLHRAPRLILRSSHPQASTQVSWLLAGRWHQVTSLSITLKSKWTLFKPRTNFLAERNWNFF